MGQRDRRDDRRIGYAHLVMLLHRADQPAQHGAAARDVRLVDLHRLEAPGQRRVLLEILAIFRPCRRRDRSECAARQSRLQQVRGIARAGLPAGADQRMRLVDEQDHRRRRGLHLVDHRAQALLELALHRGAGLHQADIERADLHALERRRHVAGRDALGEALGDRGLADAGLAGEDRVVLAPPHQHIDDLADLVVASQDRVHATLARLGGEVLREAVERGRALRPLGGVRARRTGGAQPRTVHRPQVLLLRALPDLAVAGRKLLDGDLGEFL